MPESMTNVLTDRLAEYFKLRDEVDALDNTLKDLKEKLEQSELGLVDYMESVELSQIKDSAGRMVYLSKPKVRASIKEGMKEDALTWVRSNGLEEFIQAAVPPSSLSRIIKERMEAGEDVPENLFSVYFQKGLSARR